jgi:hypothetical protein
LILDDIQELFNLNRDIIDKVLKGLIHLIDNKKAQVVLLSSDTSVKNKISSFSGMSSRVGYLSFPKIPNKFLK